MVSDMKQVAGPCYACGSECHWLQCPKRLEFDELKRKGKVGGPSQTYKIAMHAAAIFQAMVITHPTSEEEKGFSLGAMQDEVSPEKPGIIRK